MNRKEDLKELKKYCINYITEQYGKKNNYIRKTRITKNGLFIYGHKVYSPRYMEQYTIYTFINWYDSNNYQFINDMLDYFIPDCKRLKEAK